ncbi:MAG TPA: gliding motility-associated C-terminal domain-containing protein, partial [Puia sp.]|nr:gliding motility-associated C-terminal domain-containing protein [Puia sp.]
VNWNPIQNTGASYTANDLSATTSYRALVQNGNTCNIDTSLAATVAVDQKSVGGTINPANTDICGGQDPVSFLTLKNNTGAVLNWQSAQDAVHWSDMNPAVHDSSYQATGITSSIQFRSIVKNGVCIPDTSTLAKIQLFSADFPQARISPTDTTICYGGVAALEASISIGTSYTWGNYNALANPGDGNITATPLLIQAQASPLTTVDYILIVQNAGCPNWLLDTFHVNVLAPIRVDAGRDTAVVVNQPLQLNANSSEPGSIFAWTPSIGLNDPFIPNPIAVFDAGTDSVRFLVTATSSFGCFGTADVLVKVFRTGPDIFVPNAFTPGKSSNAIFRPIPVGVASIQYFRIFNRWGQIVYSTTRPGDGWDGTLDGKPQSDGSYVWMVQGTSYTGKTIFKKGVMTLIR